MSGASTVSFDNSRRYVGVIHLASTRYHFAEMNVQLDFPRQILSMTGDDPLSELGEAFFDVLSTAIKLGGTVDAIADIHVDPKRGAIHGPNQLQVGIRIIGDAPSHHLDGELGSLGFDLVDDAAAILDRCIEEFP